MIKNVLWLFKVFFLFKGDLLLAMEEIKGNLV